MIEFGRYYYVNKPIIGQLEDFSMWDKVLEKEAKQMFSERVDVVKGNVINSKFQFNITGKLVTNIEISDKDFFCNEVWSFLHIPVHIPRLDSTNNT